MDKYIPMDIDRAVCAAVGEWHCTPEQRRVIRAHADTIEAQLVVDNETETALEWVIAQDNAGNSVPFDTAARYMFGDTLYTGALAWLVDLVQYRRTEKAHNAVALEAYRAALDNAGPGEGKEL